jgi:hypothetical protein
MMQVLAVPAAFADGSRALARTSDVFSTDDNGVYRIYGLEPGRYLVILFPRMGGLASLDVMSSAEIDAALAKLRSRGATPTAAPVPTSVVAAPSTSHVYAPIYFPGTPAVSDAQLVTLGAGEERAGADLVLTLFKAATVEGMVTTFDGSPATGVKLSMAASGPQLPTGFLTGPALTAVPGADGTFKVTGAVPGTYVVMAWTAAPGPGSALVARETLVVAGDISGLRLTLAPMPTLKGRVTFAGATLAPPKDLTAVRLQLTLPSAAPISATAGVTRGGTLALGPMITNSFTFLKADGTFEFTPTSPGTYRLTIQIPGAAPGQGWWPRSAVVGGRDVLDTFVTLAPGRSISDAVVTLSDRHTELAGTLQTPAGQPANDFFIIAFPTDRALWTGALRRLQSTRPGIDGAFSIHDLPAGEYFLAALSDIDQDEWQDTAFLSQVIAGAVKVTLLDGQRTVQPLRIGG